MYGTFAGFLSSNPFLSVILLFLFSGVIGSLIAVSKDKNILFYFLLCLIPVFLVYIAAQKHEKEKLGSFRQCAYCHQFLPWDTEICSNCKYPVKLS